MASILSRAQMRANDTFYLKFHFDETPPAAAVVGEKESS